MTTGAATVATALGDVVALVQRTATTGIGSLHMVQPGPWDLPKQVEVAILGMTALLALLCVGVLVISLSSTPGLDAPTQRLDVRDSTGRSSSPRLAHDEQTSATNRPDSPTDDMQAFVHPTSSDAGMSSAVSEEIWQETMTNSAATRSLAAASSVLGGRSIPARVAASSTAATTRSSPSFCASLDTRRFDQTSDDPTAVPSAKTRTTSWMEKVPGLFADWGKKDSSQLDPPRVVHRVSCEER